jgi:hypothetical protein
VEIRLVKKINRLLCFLLPVTGVLVAARINGYVSSTAYTFAREAPDRSQQFHLRLYQSLVLQANGLGFTSSQLSFAGVFYTDPLNPFDNEPRFQVYQLRYRFPLFAKRLDLSLGRQFVTLSSASARLDGMVGRFRVRSLQFQVVAGGYVPASGWTGDPITNHFAGVELEWTRGRNLTLKGGVSAKAHERAPYRFQINSRETAIEIPATLQRRLGLQAKWHFKGISVYARTRNDLHDLRPKDVLMQLEYQYRRLENLVFEYRFREPQLPDNSIFSVFANHSNRELRLSGSVRLTTRSTGNFLVRHIRFADEQATIYTIGGEMTHLAFSLNHQMGYGGTADFLTITGHSIWNNLYLYGKLTWGNYRLLEGTWNDLVTCRTGLRLPLWNKVQLQVEFQWLSNRYYARDLRGLMSLTYRL